MNDNQAIINRSSGSSSYSNRKGISCHVCGKQTGRFVKCSMNDCHHVRRRSWSESLIVFPSELFRSKILLLCFNC